MRVCGAGNCIIQSYDKLIVHLCPHPLPFTLASSTAAFMNQVWFLATYGLYADVHASIKTDEDVARVHANTELFDPKAEHVFTYLQVFSAMCVMFAHGAGWC